MALSQSRNDLNQEEEQSEIENVSYRDGRFEMHLCGGVASSSSRSPNNDESANGHGQQRYGSAQHRRWREERKDQKIPGEHGHNGQE